MDAASKIFYFYTILKNYFYNRKPYFEYLSTFSVIVELKFSTGFAKLIDQKVRLSHPVRLKLELHQTSYNFNAISFNFILISIQMCLYTWMEVATGGRYNLECVKY